MKNTNWKDRYWQARQKRRSVRSQNMTLINLSYYTVEWHFMSLFGWAFSVGIMMIVAFWWILCQRYVPNVEPHLFVPWLVVIIRFYTRLDDASLSHVDFISNRTYLFSIYFAFCAAYNLYLGYTDKDYFNALIDSPWIYFIPYAKEVFSI